jgi:hypothetical protein
MRAYSLSCSSGICLLCIVVCWDSGSKFGRFKKHVHISQDEEAELVDRDILEEVRPVTNSNDCLCVVHASKALGITSPFPTYRLVRQKEISLRYLLGPNWAGKTTLVSLIRGDLKIQDRRGEIFVKGISLNRHIASA